MPVTRLGVSGYSQIPYGSFAGKASITYGLFTPNNATNGLLHPKWELWITDNATSNPVTVYSDVNGSLAHSYPIKLDRYANIPSMYLDDSDTYDLEVKNEFGVSRYTVTGFTV